MANATFDTKWQESMAELMELLHLEDHTIGLKEGESAPSMPLPSQIEAIQHWSCLYIKYIEVLRTLEACFDGIVHPQKRIDIKLVMELVMSRILELKALLVKWNPPHPDLKAPGADGPFPWEYVNFDDVLVDLKLPPKSLDIPIPRYFREEYADQNVARDKLVQALKTVKLEEDDVLLLEHGKRKMERDRPLIEMTLQEAVECLQKCERGRQGIVRGNLVHQLSQEEQTKKAFSKAANPDNYSLDPEMAASNIQRLFRGRQSRMKALKEKERELAFIGMRRPNQWEEGEGKREEESLYRELDQARTRRKTEQKENEEAYSHALIELHGTVLDEEGPDMRERLMDERRAWFTEELGKGIFPEDLTEFYLAKNPPPPDEAEEKDDKKKKKDAKGGDKKDAKKKKGDVEEEVEKIPALSGPTLFTQTLNECINRYQDVWLDRDESDNFQQKHDVELAKNVVRPNVEEEVRENVDKMLILQLQNLKTQLEQASSGGKKGKKKKGDKKKKGKKGGKKDKKGKKEKPMPGAKLTSGMDIEQMLGTLIEHKIVVTINQVKLDSLVGEFNYLGSAYQQHSEVRDAFGNWIPQDPSMSQIRQAVTEHIILPLGCPFLRVTSPYAKSMLLYGPRGSGKTMVAQAVAHHTNALFFDLSPEKLDALPAGLREGKSGPTKLIHMVFTCARNPEFGPSVIHVDQVEKIFAGKKKGAGGDAAKFKKDLVTYANSLKPEERVVIIGSSSEPFNIPDGEMKDLFNVFQKHIYMPYPDYASRVQLWRTFLENVFDKEEMDIPEQIDISALALISEGYSAGSIQTAIEKTLTERRISTLKSRPISEKDFITALSSCPLTYQEDSFKFQQFTASVTGLGDRRAKVKELRENGGDDKKKSGGKKKK